MKCSLKKTERKIKQIFELKNLLTAYEQEKNYENKSTQNLKVINLESRIEKYNQLFHLSNIVKERTQTF